MKTINNRTQSIKALLGLLTVTLSSSLASAQTTGTITLSGSVPAATAIVVTGVGTFNNLDLTTTQSNLQVANVREINNTPNGYTVRMTSANGGLLKNGSIGSLTYTARYNGVAANLNTSPVTVTNASASTSVVNVLKPLTISYTGVSADSLMAGTYSDTLTFTITAN